MSSFDWISKDYYMDETTPELLVLRRKEGLRIGFFPPDRATRPNIVRTIAKDREMKALDKKKRRGR